MKRYWTESISSFEGRNTTIEPYEDIEVYKADEVDAHIYELYDSIGEVERLRKALEEIQVEVRKPEKLPRDMEKWLKRADKRTKLKKIDDIATEALKEK